MAARKLATFRKVTNLQPIPEADLIEVATVSGWEVVVKKGEFKVGDLGMYFEIDSFLDVSKPEFSFLAKHSRNWNGKTGAIIRTMKLKKQLSQGLLLPVFPYFNKYTSYNIFGVPFLDIPEETLLGMDFTKELGVLKYERDIEETADENFLSRIYFQVVPRPVRKAVHAFLDTLIPSRKKAKRGKGQGVSSFPSYMPKTDEERIQNIFDKIKDPDDEYDATIKLDGSSTTYAVKDGEFVVCSRNVKKGITDGSNFSNVALRYELPSHLPLVAEEVGFDFALQGELMGPGIQKNREGFETHEFYLFKIWDITNKRYLNMDERYSLIAKINTRLPLPILQVPYLGRFKPFSEFESVAGFLNHATGPSINNPVREGVVYERVRDQFSFKAISNKYLLQETN